MKLYFDNNIYGLIDESARASDVAEYIRRSGYRVVASSTNVIEFFAAPEAIRVSRLKTLSAVATEYERFPGSLLETTELLAELRRCHPEWVRRPDRQQENKLREFRRGH